MDQTPKQTGSRRAVPNKTQAAPTDSEEYEVEKVLSKKVIDGTVQYLIKWKEEEGGEKWENSWEPVENLVNALAKVRLYEEGELEARKKQVASTSSAGSVSGQTKRKASTSAGPSGQTNQQKKTKCEQKRMELIKSKTLVKNVVAIHRKEGDKDETEKIVVHFENEMMIFVCKMFNVFLKTCDPSFCLPLIVWSKTFFSLLLCSHTGFIWWAEADECCQYKEGQRGN